MRRANWVHTVGRGRLSRGSRLVATRLGLGTASLFGLLASHRSGVRVPHASCAGMMLLPMKGVGKTIVFSWRKADREAVVGKPRVSKEWAGGDSNSQPLARLGPKPSASTNFATCPHRTAICIHARVDKSGARCGHRSIRHVQFLKKFVGTFTLLSRLTSGASNAPRLNVLLMRAMMP